MNEYRCIRRFPIVLTLFFTLLGLLNPECCQADVRGEGSGNAALHYNRAMIQLAVLPVDVRQQLNEPFWLSLGDLSKEQMDEIVSRVVFQGRHALRIGASRSP